MIVEWLFYARTSSTTPTCGGFSFFFLSSLPSVSVDFPEAGLFSAAVGMWCMLMSSTLPFPWRLQNHLSFPKFNSIESIEFVENYFQLFWKWKLVFYKFYRFCRILILVTLKMKITKNSLRFYMYRIEFEKTQLKLNNLSSLISFPDVSICTFVFRKVKNSVGT